MHIRDDISQSGIVASKRRPEAVMSLSMIS
jgi:hypothetical protein